MNKIGQELDKRLDENKYELYEALKTLLKLLTPRTPEDSRQILKAEQVLSKVEGRDINTNETS